MKVSVVIPALDEAGEIAAAIESATAPGVEILVADGGSGDDTRERARGAGARVVETPPGRARQLAAGARETTGDVLLFLHADSRLPRGYDAALRRALDDPSVVGGSFSFAFDVCSPALRIVAWGARARVALARLPYGDQALFVRRAVLERIGGVPQAEIMEDLDLIRAMKREGRIAILPEPVTTSARRYLRGGVFRTMFRNWLAVLAWTFGADRRRIARWVGR